MLKHPGSLRAMFWPLTEHTMGEAYIYDDFDIEGNMEAIFPIADALLAHQHFGPGTRLKRGLGLLDLPSHGRTRPPHQPVERTGAAHSVERDRAAVSYHHDQSNEFYQL